MENEKIELLKQYKQQKEQENNGLSHCFTVDKFDHTLCISTYATKRNWTDYIILTVSRLYFINDKIEERDIAGCSFFISREKSKQLYLTNMEISNKIDLRNGYGTLILEFLEDYAQKENLSKIKAFYSNSNLIKAMGIKKFFASNDYSFSKIHGRHYIIKKSQDFRTLNTTNVDGLIFISSKTNDDTLMEM